MSLFGFIRILLQHLNTPIIVRADTRVRILIKSSEMASNDDFKSQSCRKKEETYSGKKK